MEQNPTTIIWPTQIGEIEQSKISLWFKFREVADDERFGDYFQRVLDESAVQYQQLLRIEPGVTTYDWLVSKYTEAQRKTIGTESVLSESTDSNKKTGTISLSHGHTIISQKRGDDTNELEYGHTISKTASEGIANGTVVNTGTISDSGTKNNTRTGSVADRQTDTRHMVESQTTSHDGNTTIKDDRYTSTNQKRLEKVNPMSSTYQSGSVADPTVDTQQSQGGTNAAGMVLDWSSPSGQGQNFGRDIEHSEHTQTDPDITVSRESYIEPNGFLEDTKTYNSLQDSQTTGNTKRLDTTKTTNYTKTINDTDTHSGSDTTTKSYNSDTSTVNSGTDTTTRNLTDSISRAGSADKDTTSRDRYQQTGRNEAPAELLKEAVRFISNTNAWKWLREQLEVCFIGIYD